MDPVAVMKKVLTFAGEFLCVLGIFACGYFVLLIT